MSIKNISNKDKVEFDRAAVHPLQSWEWGEFRKETGNEVVRLGIYQEKTLTDAVQVIFQ
jgi:lipid II:glycine glycyltransferase (peptidoglycan interpeptide bridge formation enzyme)